MKTFLAGMIFSGLGAVGQSVGTGGVTQLLALAASGGVLGLIAKAYIDRKKDSAGLSERAMQAISDSLDSVTNMRKDMDALAKELGQVRQDLYAANQQIEELERRLVTANGDRDRVQAELDASVHARDALQAQITDLEGRLGELEAQGLKRSDDEAR